MASHGEVEAAEPIARERVGAALQHERSRLIDLHHLLHDGHKDSLIALVVNAVLERNVERVVLACLHTDVLDIAGPGEEVVPVLMERDSHHAVRRVEGLLDAVAVVDVDVEIQDTWVVLKQLEDAQHNVVHVAKSRRLGALRVVQAARPVDCHISNAMVELHRAIDGAARVDAAVVVQPIKDRAIFAVEPLQLLRKVLLRIGRDAPHKVDVLG